MLKRLDQAAKWRNLIRKMAQKKSVGLYRAAASTAAKSLPSKTGKPVGGFYGKGAAEVVPVIREGLPVASFYHVQECLGVTIEELAGAIGIPSRTLARRKQEGRLQKYESERLYRVSRLFEKAAAVFEGEQPARDWFHAPQKALGGRTPLEFADTEPGAREVENLLGRIEHGVFA